MILFTFHVIATPCPKHAKGVRPTNAGAIMRGEGRLVAQAWAGTHLGLRTRMGPGGAQVL
ncbi:MAG: hypothetical protein RL071_1701 [Pseudomonadota bacterium]